MSAITLAYKNPRTDSLYSGYISESKAKEFTEKFAGRRHYQVMLVNLESLELSIESYNIDDALEYLEMHRWQV